MNRNDKFYNIEEATEILGISEQEVINMIILKKLPAIRVEKAIKIKEEDLEKFLGSLGRKDTADKNEIGKTMEVLVEDKDEVKEKLENKKMQLEKSYKDLLREKQELGEDINYLQYKYDEFKNRIKKITTEEFKISLKKIDEENLKEVIKEAGNNMYKNKLLKRKSIYNYIISSLERILWEKNQETKGHTERLKRLALQLGSVINLPQNKLDEVVLLSTLHDIGKIAIPDKILMKKGKLTVKEWKIIKRHPEIGYKIAESTPQIAPIAEDILSHHEWWNGNGYPQGLGEGDIPVKACITSIVDAYDVMTFGRPYREAISEEEAIEELRRCSGTQFNPMLVQKFVILLKKLN